MTYNIGGPIYVPKFRSLKDKLFFFWNHEILPGKSTGALQYSTMPNALRARRRFFSGPHRRKTGHHHRSNRRATILAGNVIPKNRLDANGQALLNVLPLPNITNTAITKGAYNYDTQFTSTSPTQLYLLKLDYNMSTKDSLSMTVPGMASGKTNR